MSYFKPRSFDDSDAASEAVNTSHARLFVVIAIFSIAFFILSVRVFDVSVMRGGGKYFVASNSYNDGMLKERTDIVDRNGELLAVNLATASLYANPQIIMNVKEAVDKLHDIFPEMNRDTLYDRLSSNKSFVWIKRHLAPQEQYKANALGIPGLFFKNEEKRVYPQKELFSHVLGFVNLDGKGIMGVERQFDEYLTGRNESGENNQPLRLSLDVRVQSIVHQVMADVVKEFSALGASSIVMDVHTGEVISMVSLPDFNLNNPVVSQQNKTALFNRSTFGVYEMGSTFKTFNMALGFELGDIGMKDVYDVSKPVRIANFTINDYHQKKKQLTVPEIYMYSSNIGSAKIALDIGEEEQRSFLRRLGLLSGLDVEIPEKSEPLYPDRWGKVRSVTISYGHGIAVTPLHVTKATAALVNGGYLKPATVIKVPEGKDIEGQKVISDVNSDKIRKIMRLAVQYGTGGRADVSGYFVGGKTGSADKADNGSYDRKANISSFVGAFPMDKPRYVVFVMIDDPIGNTSTGGYTTGGMIAAPAAGKIIKRIAPVLDVMPVDESDYKIRREFWYNNEDENPKVAAVQFD